MRGLLTGERRVLFGGWDIFFLRGRKQKGFHHIDLRLSLLPVGTERTQQTDCLTGAGPGKSRLATKLLADVET